MSKQRHSVVEEFMMSPEYVSSGKLEIMHTRQLLAIKNSLFIYASGNNDLSGDLLFDKVKSIPSTREHIPNKVEARKIRQDKAKFGH